MAGLGEMLTGLEGFRQAVHQLPRMSTDQIRAGRRMEKVLQQAIDIIRTGKTSLEAVLPLLS